MPNIVFVTPDGMEHQVTVEDGVTVMEAGRDAGLGIEGTCGGCLSCATCHVIVDADWFAATGAPNEDEMDMLDLAMGLAKKHPGLDVKLKCRPSLMGCGCGFRGGLRS